MLRVAFLARLYLKEALCNITKARILREPFADVHCVRVARIELPPDHDLHGTYHSYLNMGAGKKQGVSV